MADINVSKLTKLVKQFSAISLAPFPELLRSRVQAIVKSYSVSCVMTDEPVATVSPAFTLHVWPGQWGLPSFDPTCLATILYLQLVLPGEFSVLECNNPDDSPSGQLPFLVHNQVTVTSFPAITKYIANLKTSGQRDLDVSLSPTEKSQKVAWASHVEFHLGNLVYHTYYSSPSNWEKVVHPALVEMYGLPQRYYVPERIRLSFKPRLESAGLWTLPLPEPEKKLSKEKRVDTLQKKAKEAYNQAFGKEKVQEKAKEVMGIYARLLEGKQYVYHERPTTLDLLIAAHTLLLITPPLPDTLIKELAEEWYDTLADHAKRVQAIAFGNDRPKFFVRPSRNSIWDLVPSHQVVKTAQTKERTPEDAEYEKLTWGFFGLALGSVAAYFAIMGSPIRIIVARGGLEGEEDENKGEIDEDEGDDEGVQLDG